MIGILCKHWQISPEEFGRLFNIHNPEPFYNGTATLSAPLYERFSKVMQLATKMEAEGSIALELEAFQQEHNLTVKELSNGIRVSTDTIQRWMNLEAKPNRASTLRVAAYINRSPLEEEWGYQFDRLVKNMTMLGMRKAHVAEQMGVTIAMFSTYYSGKCNPRTAYMELWLPWLTDFNDSLDKVRPVWNTPPNKH